jgi:hypothetical protein
MSQESPSYAAHVLESSNRQAQARAVLQQLPPTGVRSWELPLAYAVGTAVGASLYVSGQTPITSVLAGAALSAAILAAAASAETRKLAKRLAAVEAILLQRSDAA